MADAMASQPSSPTTLLSQSSTLINTPTTTTTASPCTLLSLTPELLLQIISHLPTTTYHSLTRTSHGLRLFFKTHAAHICNTYISQHFPLEAQLLNSVVVDGWLVPTHQAVYTNLSTSSLPRTGEILGLAEPGPQYLRFLQEYSKVILIRAEMTIHASSHVFPSTSTSPTSPTSQAQPQPQEISPEEAAQAQRDFTFMLSTYCIRPFTTRLNSPSQNTALKHPPPTRQVFGELPDEKPTPGLMRTEDTHTALSWYFGAAGVRNCAVEQSQRIGFSSTGRQAMSLGVWERVRLLMRKKIGVGIARGKETVKKRFGGFKARVLRVGQSVKGKFLGAWVRNGFRALD